MLDGIPYALVDLNVHKRQRSAAARAISFLAGLEPNVKWTVWQSFVYMLECEKYPTYGSYDTMLPYSPHSHPPCVVL